MPTLAEKIEAVVREAFHDGWLELDDVSERLLLTLCRRAANLAIEEATQSIPATWLDPMLSGPDSIVSTKLSPRDIQAVLIAVLGRIRALALPEDKP